MALTIAQVREHLLDHAPEILDEPSEVFDAVLEALVAVFFAVDGANSTLHTRTYVGEADGSWLDQHGAERGIYRFTDESDVDYRARVEAIEDQVTRPAILAAVDAILQVGSATMGEHMPDGAFADIQGLQGFADHAVAYSGMRNFTVYIPEQYQTINGTAWALDPAATPTVMAFAIDPAEAPDMLGFAHDVDPTPGDIYARVWHTVNRLRAAGVAFRVVVQ